MTSHLDALVESNKQLTVEEQHAAQEQEKDAAREMDVQDDPVERPNFVVLMISIAILVFGIWWVMPW